jgi:hypothetical protein
MPPTAVEVKVGAESPGRKVEWAFMRQDYTILKLWHGSFSFNPA